MSVTNKKMGIFEKILPQNKPEEFPLGLRGYTGEGSGDVPYKALSEPLSGPKEPTQEPNQRIPIALEKLREQVESARNLELRPRVGMLADGGKIENQQVDVIDADDEGLWRVCFKLTEAHYKKILEKARSSNDWAKTEILLRPRVIKRKDGDSSSSEDDSVSPFLLTEA